MNYIPKSPLILLSKRTKFDTKSSGTHCYELLSTFISWPFCPPCFYRRVERFFFSFPVSPRKWSIWMVENKPVESLFRKGKKQLEVRKYTVSFCCDLLLAIGIWKKICFKWIYGMFAYNHLSFQLFCQWSKGFPFERLSDWILFGIGIQMDVCINDLSFQLFC